MSDGPSRRRFLTAGVAATVAASAGCLGDFGGRDRAETERVLELTLSEIGDSLRDHFVDDLADTRPEWDEQAFEAVLAGETYTTQYRKPFLSRPDDPTYAERDGTYYRLDSVVVDEATAVHPVVRLFEVGDADDSSTPDGVAADSLPERDQTAIHVAYMAARARDNEGGAPWGLVQRGGCVYRRDEATGESDRDETADENDLSGETDESTLLSDDPPEYVTYREHVYELAVTREQFHEPVYRATAEPVAETPERMEAILRAQFVDARFSHQELSTAAQDVMLTASGDGYNETHPYSEGYREVLRTLHERAYLDGNTRKDAGVEADSRQYVRYDGVYYDYMLRFDDRSVE